MGDRLIAAGLTALVALAIVVLLVAIYAVTFGLREQRNALRLMKGSVGDPDSAKARVLMEAVSLASDLHVFAAGLPAGGPPNPQDEGIGKPFTVKRQESLRVRLQWERRQMQPLCVRVTAIANILYARGLIASEQEREDLKKDCGSFSRVERLADRLDLLVESARLDS